MRQEVFIPGPMKVFVRTRKRLFQQVKKGPRQCFHFVSARGHGRLSDRRTWPRTESAVSDEAGNDAFGRKRRQCLLVNASSDRFASSRTRVSKVRARCVVPFAGKKAAS